MNNAALLSTVKSAAELSEEQLDNVNGGAGGNESCLPPHVRKVIENGEGTVIQKTTSTKGITTMTETVTMNGKTTVYVNGQLQ